jgi:hypothetical protein
MARKSIPDTIKLQLWVKSAGRCEFKGCNKPVWRNELTLSDGNFGEVAHIIGSSNDGPRGTEKSEELQIDFSNLMLLCQACHKEIDDNTDKYSIELLQKWKLEHENRVEIQTSFPEDIHKSTVLTFSVNINERITPINQEALRGAMFPKYPIDKGIKIEETDFNKSGLEEEWQAFAENKIKRKLERALEVGYDDVNVKHISIFAIAPMPLLFFLGKCIGDTIPCDIYQSHRNISDTSKTWNWQNLTEIETSFEVSCEVENNSDTILLKLAISDYLNKDKYLNLIENNESIYQITVNAPSPHFLKTKKQLENFSYEYRKLLNLIQNKHGANCKIYILPAVPISVAIESGRVIIPTKDPEIYICDYEKSSGFRKVLRVN